MSYPPIPVVNLTDGRTLTSGLYVVRAQQSDKPFEHVALLDLSGVLRLSGRDPSRAVIIELTNPQLQFRYLDDITHAWVIGPRVEDEAGAARRWDEAILLPNYHLLWNNCEHLVTFITTGKRESPQIDEGLKFLAGTAAAILFIAAVTRKAA